MFQTVHVVSIEDVTTRLGAFSFHEKFVNGALEFWFCTFDCCGIQGVDHVRDNGRWADMRTVSHRKPESKRSNSHHSNTS